MGLFRMETGSKRKYEQFAEECERLAMDAKSEHHRTVLREMALAWRKLAEAATRRA
jgi:vacuolar-type H+-ATPase subunit B/Vma2